MTFLFSLLSGWKSLKRGKPWAVAVDEPGDAQHSLVQDKDDPIITSPGKMHFGKPLPLVPGAIHFAIIPLTGVS